MASRPDSTIRFSPLVQADVAPLMKSTSSVGSASGVPAYALYATSAIASVVTVNVALLASAETKATSKCGWLVSAGSSSLQPVRAHKANAE